MKRPRTYASLHEWLDKTGTQQQVLAEMAGIPDSTLSQLLRYSRRCSLRTALRLHEITGVPVETLVEWPKFRDSRKNDSAA